MTAQDILAAAAATIDQRGAERDRPEGERSMGRAVRAFNALFSEEIAANGGLLTETQGWRFMEVLKLARGRGPDEFLDGAAYVALAGEAEMREPRT